MDPQNPLTLIPYVERVTSSWEPKTEHNLIAARRALESLTPSLSDRDLPLCLKTWDATRRILTQLSRPSWLARTFPLFFGETKTYQEAREVLYHRALACEKQLNAVLNPKNPLQREHVFSFLIQSNDPKLRKITSAFYRTLTNAKRDVNTLYTELRSAIAVGDVNQVERYLLRKETRHILFYHEILKDALLSVYQHPQEKTQRWQIVEKLVKAGADCYANLNGIGKGTYTFFPEKLYLTAAVNNLQSKAFKAMLMQHFKAWNGYERWTGYQQLTSQDALKVANFYNVLSATVTQPTSLRAWTFQHQAELEERDKIRLYLWLERASRTGNEQAKAILSSDLDFSIEELIDILPPEALSNLPPIGKDPRSTAFEEARLKKLAGNVASLPVEVPSIPIQGLAYPAQAVQALYLDSPLLQTISEGDREQREILVPSSVTRRALNILMEHYAGKKTIRAFTVYDENPQTHDEIQREVVTAIEALMLHSFETQKEGGKDYPIRKTSPLSFGKLEHLDSLSDVEIVIDGEKLPVHSHVLAHLSPVFRKKFLEPENSNKWQLDKEDLFPMPRGEAFDRITSEDLKKFIHYLYTQDRSQYEGGTSTLSILCRHFEVPYII